MISAQKCGLKLHLISHTVESEAMNETAAGRRLIVKRKGFVFLHLLSFIIPRKLNFGIILQVYSWATNQHPPAELPVVTDIKEGSILGVRYSLDGKILAIQRTNQEIEFVNKESCTGFKQQCRSGSDRILGFFWTDCPACDIVFVTTRCDSLRYSHPRSNN